MGSFVKKNNDDETKKSTSGSFVRIGESKNRKGFSTAPKVDTPATTPISVSQSRLSASESLWDRGSAFTGIDIDAKLNELAELRRQAAVDLDTTRVDELDKRMKSLRAQAGQQTVGDRVSDTLSAIVSGTAAQGTNVVGFASNAVNNPEYHQRSIARLEETLKSGRTTDGKVLTDAMRETIKASIADHKKRVEELEKEDSFTNRTYKAADQMAGDSAKYQSKAKQGLGAVGSTLVDAGVAFGQSALAGTVGAVTGTGMLPFAVTAFGGATQDARRNGATLDEQLTYGTAQAAKEYVTEKLFGLAVPQKIAGSVGSFDGLIEKGIRNVTERLAKTPGGQQALGGLMTWLAGGVTEGLEEGIGALVEETIINPHLRGFVEDERTTQEKFEEGLYNVLVGGVSGLLGVTNLLNYSPSAQTATVTDKSGIKAPSTKPATETATSPAAAPEVQQVQAQAEVTKAQNPEAEVLDAATTLFTQQGMNLKTAQTRAEIVGKLIRGEEVSDKDLNRIDPTSNQTKQIFTQLTGVQFPEGKIQIEALRNLYRSAHTVAQAARVTMKEQAIQEIQQMSAEQIAERAKQARQATTPESDAQAARILAQARGEIAPDGTPLLSYKDFTARLKQVTPDASPQEAARMYDLYLRDNQTISFMGRRMTRQQVRNTLRSAPDGDKLTVAELDAMFDVELEAQSRDGKDATEHSVRNKEANNGRREDSVHSAGLSGQPDQRSRGQGRSISGETGRAEGDGGARGETGTRHSVQGRNQEERQSDARNVRTRGVTLRNSQEVLEVVPETYTPEMQTVSDKFARIGIPVHIIYGGYQIPGTDKYADGVSVLGSETYIQADAVEELAKLGDHEFVHQVVFSDLSLKQAAYEALVSRMSDEDFETALTEYSLEYSGAYSHDPAMMLSMIEEMVADAYAGIDRFGLGVVVAHQDAIKDVIDIWVDTYSASYGQEVTLTDDAGNLVVETDDQGHSRFSMSTYDESGRDILTQWMGRAVVNGDLTSQDADDIIKTMDLIYDICKEARESGEYAPFDAWSEAKVVVNEKGEPVFSVVKANGDYAMNLDFSLVCKKRRTLDAVLNELVKRGFVDNLALNEKQIVRINDLIRSYGFETACDLCFVDAKRYRQGKVADDFVKLYNDLVLSMVPKNSGLQPQYFNFGNSTLVTNDGAGIHELPDAELDFTKIDKVLATKGEKTVEYKTAMLLKNSPADRKLTMRGDFLSTRGFDAINRENPRVLKLFNSKKGSGGPKSAVSDVQYLNEVLTSKTFTPEKAYAVGGVRIQSFSDYVPRMVFDYVQMIADLAAKKLPAHAYTKEELFVKQFGLTGMKINMSLIPKVVDGGIAPGLDADGNYVWADESFDFEEAMRIQNADGYSRNCGTIAVGVSDEHIRALMADPEIRMVIPYHKSGLSPIVAKMNKIDQFVNYTDFQNTRHPHGKHGKKLSKDVAADKKLLDEMPDFNTRMRELGDPRAAAEEYVRWCEKHDLLPKFDQFAYKQIDGVIVEKDGQRVVDENYYKLLEDFTVYDNGKYTPQTGLTMTFPNEDSAFGSMKELIKRGLEEDAVLEGKRDAKVPEIVGEIMKFSVAEDKPFDLSDYTIDDILKWSDEEFDRAYEALGLADTLSDDVLLDDDFSVEDIAEEMEEAPEKIEILYRRAGLGGSHVAEDKQAVMTEERIDARIKEHGATQPDYARRYITRIAPKDFIDMTVYERNVDRQNFDTRVGGDFGTKMGEWDFESALRDSEEPPVLIIDKSTGQIIGHNGRHRIRALEMAGIESVEIEVQLHDEDGYMIKYNAETIPDMAISSQFDTKIETHLSNIIPLNRAHRDEILSSYGEKAHADAAVKYSITPQFEKWYKETYGTELTSAQLKRRLKTAERRAAEAEHDKKAAELKNTIDSEMDLTAWMIHHTKKMREQKRVSDAKLADARKAKTEAVRTAVAEMKEIERAKAEVQHDADRMAERRNAAKRLRTQENAYTNKVTEMKENAKLKRNAAKATLRDSRLAAKKRAAIETEQGLVDTIRKNPKQRTGVEKLQDAAQQLRTLGRSAYRNFVNMAESIDRFSKRQVSDMRAGTLVNILGGSASTMEAVFKKGLVDRAGNRIGESMSDVFLCWDDAHKKVNEGQQALLQDFMLHWHNIDRMSIVARAESALETFELNNEWLRDMDQKEFARLVAMTEKEVEKLGKYEAQQQAFEYVRLIRAYNEAQNKPIFADDKGNSVTAETSQRIVDQYLEEHPWLLEKANGIYEWWDLFMRNWAVGDTISEAEYNRMHQMYPHYVPTYRADKNGVGGAGFVGAGGATVSKAVKKAKGSHSEVMNIEDSFSNIVSKIIRLNRLNELYMNIIDTAMLDEDGTFADMAYFDWDWQDGAYANALITGSADIADLTDTVDATEKAGLEKVGSDYKLTGWLNGRKYTAYISEDLYKSIGMVTGHLANDLEQNLLKAGNTLTKLMKSAITGYNPTFAIRNLSRDLPTAVINSISGLNFPKYYAQAAKEIAKNSDHWKTFQALGGTHATYYNDNKGFAADMMPRNLVEKAFSTLGAFNEITEAQTRFAEYLATIDKLGDTYEARLQGIKNAAEVTVDFSRKGRYGKVINAWVPYWNPAVQGIDKTVRSVIDSPDGSAIWKQASKTLGRAAMTTILFEAILHGVLKALDRDDEWEELNDRTKDTYYCIPLKDSNRFLKIPKNREWGAILGTPFMRMLEWANGREDPFENYIETAIEPNFLPPAVFRPDAGGGFVSDVIGVSQALDLAKNEDFAGRTIVPYAYQQGTLSQQFDNETSALAKKLGELFDWSPMQIDYIIGDYFGDFGDMFINATSEATRNGEQNIGEAALKIVTNPFFADARYSNASVSKYYDLMDELGRVVQDKKNQMGNDAAKETLEYQTEKAIDEMYGKQISELNRIVRELPDGTEKDNAKAQIAQLTKEAIEFYNDSMAGKVSNPILTATYNGYSESVAKELTRMDSYSEQYSFKPRTTAPTSYVDPKNKKNEYRLDDEQKEYFMNAYTEKYDEIFGRLIQSSKYRKADNEKKAELLEDAKADVNDAAKEELFDWLEDNRVRSTPKK